MKIALPTDRPTPAPTAPAPHPIRHVPPAATREIGKSGNRENFAGRNQQIPQICVIFAAFNPTRCGNSSIGRASASQAEGRGFESRFPLLIIKGLRQQIVTPYSFPVHNLDTTCPIGLRPASPAGKPPAGIRHEQQNDIYPKVTPRAYKATQSPRTPLRNARPTASTHRGSTQKSCPCSTDIQRPLDCYGIT